MSGMVKKGANDADDWCLVCWHACKHAPETVLSVPHAICSHRDCIADADGVEPQADQTNLMTTLFHFLC